MRVGGRQSLLQCKVEAVAMLADKPLVVGMSLPVISVETKVVRELVATPT